MAKMDERLEKMVERYREINDLMMQSDVVSDRKTMAKLGREQNELTPIVETYEEYKKAVEELEEAKVLSKEEDKEIREMAQMELEELEPKIQNYLDRLELLLVPKDPNDSHNAILEIRGAAGGDEGNIFAGDLFRMYSKYAEAKGWRTEVIEMEDSEAGGFSLVSFKVNGEGAYGTLKFESGSHRVQRVPNKTDSAVRIVHKPTGIVVKCQDGRSQHENRATALMTIRARVYEERQRELDQKNEKERRTKIGTGDRAEKIRTYNYPQNRVTDHRIGYTVNQLDRIMDGRLDDLMAALQLADQQAKIAGDQ